MIRFGFRLVLPLVLVGAMLNPARADQPAPVAPLPDVRPDEEEPPAIASASPPPARVWYGWQVLATDGALVALTAGALAVEQEDLALVPLFGLFASGAVVHATHGHGLRALGSAGMRLGLPLAGGLIGAAIANCPPHNPDAWLDLCGVGETALGMASGMAIAIAIDSIWAYDEVAPTPSPARPSQHVWSLTPAMSVTQNSAGVGLVGRF